MMKTYLNVVECAIEYKEKFLIIQRPEGVHAGGLLSFPGGKIEEQDELHGEDILKTGVQREILEEVGITLTDPLRYIRTTYFMGKPGIHVLNTLFHCVFKEEPIVIPSPREVPVYFWMTRAEIDLSLNAPSWLKESLKGILT